MTDFINTFDPARLLDLLRYDAASPLLFNTGLFLLLFAGFMAVYHILRHRPTLRMVATILFSLYFYYKSSAECCLLLLGICLNDYLAGLALGALRRPVWRRVAVGYVVVADLAMLCFFKYFNLLGDLWARATATHFDALTFLVPAGISFITFRSISYIVDIYRGDMAPERNLLHYTFSLTFFAPLLAGPVVRARDFLPQIKAHPTATPQMTAEGFFLIMAGLVKKVLIADYISSGFVDRIFDNPSLYSGFEVVTGCIGFTLQLYCDFSGYSDMAIGLALLMGYRFKDNFRAPFKSQNPQEFWRRWHISLSTWLRDYLYIPLGGSRRGKWRTYLNNLLTMALGGLWHGAGWMYLLWGVYHGLLLAGHKALRGVWRLPEVLRGTLPVRAANIAVTFALVVVGFAIFRAPSVDTLSAMWTQIWGDFHLSVAPQFVTSYAMITAAIAAGLLLHFAPSRWTLTATRAFAATPAAAQSLVLAVVLFMVIQARSADLVPFIYLQY
ncbi:MAG: MBOAT family protein [Bacteroides sp.]|nr:MBOAT family protein [Bacteroides sp.]MCM1096228.1 MBOAT family protein [Terasakiella sp.]